MAVLDPVIEERVRRTVEILSRHARVSAAYVFGSQAGGKIHEFSDIDIGIFIENLEDWDLRRRARTCALVQKEAGDDIEIHFLPARTLSRADPASFAAYILCHGLPVTSKKAKLGKR